MLATNAPMFRGNQLAAAVYLGTKRLWARPETLLLDFASGQYRVGGIAELPSSKQFSELITFARASGGGRFNAQGQYEWLPADQPRIDYDPVTGECRGLLIEEQRTNLLTYSSDFANAAWQKEYVTIEASDGVAPITGEGMQKLVPSATQNIHRLRRSFTPNIDTDYSYSIFAKAAGYNYLYINAGILGVSGTVNLITGEVYQKAGRIAAYPQGGGVFRVVISGKSPSTLGASGFYTQVNTSNATTDETFTGDGTSGIYIWGAQLEAGAFPTSLIHTTDAQVTRAADIASVNELSPWFNASEGTLFVEYLAPARTSTAQYPGVIGLSATATSNRMGIYNRTDTGVCAMLVREGGVTHADVSIPGTAFTSGAVVKAAIGYASDGVSGCVNGGTIASDTSVVVPAVDNLRIGQMDSARISSHIKSIRYFPRRLSDTELQALTA